MIGSKSAKCPPSWQPDPGGSKITANHASGTIDGKAAQPDLISVKKQRKPRPPPPKRIPSSPTQQRRAKPNPPHLSSTKEMAFFPEENPFRTAFRLVLSWLKVWGGRIAQAGSSPRRQPRPRQWDPEALPDITLQPVEMARTRPPPPPPLPPPPFDEAVLSWMRLWHRRMAHSSLEVLLTMGKGAPVWMETPLNLPEADRLAPYRDNLDCEVCAELYGTSGGPRSKPSYVFCSQEKIKELPADNITESFAKVYASLSSQGVQCTRRRGKSLRLFRGERPWYMTDIMVG